MGRRRTTDAAVTALEAVYREHHRRVRWLLRARGVGDEGLDDAMQDVFLVIHRRLPDRDPEVPLSAWVAGIACNTAFSHRRTHARRVAREQLGLDASAALDPAQALERRDAWARLRGFLDALPPAQREVFVMADLLGMTMPEIAEASQAPLATLYSRLRLARTRFAACFDARPDDAFLQRARAEAEPSAQENGRSWARLLVALPIASTKVGAPVVGAAAIGALGIAVSIAVGIQGSRDEPTTATPTATSTAPELAPQNDRERPSQAEIPLPRVVSVLEAPPPSASAPVIRATTKATSASPVPANADDELARALLVLDAAQVAVRSGDFAAALAAIDGDYDALANGPMARELARIERRAACALGRRERAMRAHVVLVGRDARTSDPCAAE